MDNSARCVHKLWTVIYNADQGAGLEKRYKALGDLPHFIVSGVLPDSSLTGHFDSLEGVSCGRCWLLLPGRTALIGDLSGVNTQDGSAVFHSASEVPPAAGGAKLPYLSAYWQAYHVWMILDESSRWERTTFHPSDAVSESFTADHGKSYCKVSKRQPDENVPANAQVVTDGWDHEHCELCNAHIDSGHSAYRNTDSLWVCPSCYENYVEPKDLSFVDEL